MKKSTMTSYDWENLEKNYLSWWSHTLERPLVVIECLADEHATGFGSTLVDLHCFPQELSPMDIAQEIENSFDEMRYLGDAFPRWWPNCGPGVLAEFLGSPTDFSRGSTWFHPLIDAHLKHTILPLSTISSQEERIATITEAMIELEGDSIVFGYPDIGGQLDIVASLFDSTEVLMGMIEYPQLIQLRIDEIQEAWCAYFKRFSALLDAHSKDIRTFRGSWLPMMAPGTTYPLQCDLSIMIGKESFEAFVLDHITSSSNSIAYPFYHLDGPGSIRHLDALLSIESLRGIQWVPGSGAPSADKWLELLKQIQDANKLCQVYVSPEGAKHICEQIGGKGFLFCIGEGGLLTEREGEKCLELLHPYM